MIAVVDRRRKKANRNVLNDVIYQLCRINDGLAVEDIHFLINIFRPKSRSQLTRYHRFIILMSIGVQANG